MNCLNNPQTADQSQSLLESRCSAEFEQTLRKQIGGKLNLNASTNAVMFSKEETYQDLIKTRASSLILTCVSYC
ncbi:MAG: hypothetical protein IPM69_04915 [Ignavibacteria bacterium]|nr:hypothetical protein [Ignavibacteria bacterium]